MESAKIFAVRAALWSAEIDFGKGALEVFKKDINSSVNHLMMADLIRYVILDRLTTRVAD
jgi:hypothetical protein